MTTEVQFSKEAISAIAASLPADTDPARLAVLPELLRAWASEDLREHLSRKGGAELRRRQKQLCAVGGKAQKLLDLIVALDPAAFFDTAIEPQMARDGTSPFETDIAAARRRRDGAIEWLVELAFVFDSLQKSLEVKQKWPSDKTILYYLIVRDLAAIFEMITERPATRRVDWDSKQAYGPFWDFIEKVWRQIFQNAVDPTYPIRVWADEKVGQRKLITAAIAAATAELDRPLFDVECAAIESRFRDSSTFAANLSLRHPDLWRKLTRTTG
jgi:hypothetical protein